MSTTISFETAQLSDALTKANKVAPVKGPGYDKAAGLLLNVNPITRLMTVRATDLDTSYLQRVTAIDGKGDETVWRLPSALLAGMVSSLPMEGEHVVTFIDRGDGAIRLTCGKWVAKLNQFRPEEFPVITEFNTDDMSPAADFANRVEQVSWACDQKSGVLCGVYVDGKRIVGCDAYSLAMVPCEVEVDHPVTVPLNTLANLLREATDVKVRAADKRFEMSLDAETQATTRLIEGKYPVFDRVMRTDFAGEVQVGRQQFQDALDRMLVLVRSERLPSMQVTFDGCTSLIKQLTFDMEVAEVGRMQDTVDVTSDEWEDVQEISIKPQALQNAVSHSRADSITIKFGHADPKRATELPLLVTDASGYQCYVMPIVKGKGK